MHHTIFEVYKYAKQVPARDEEPSAPTKKQSLYSVFLPFKETLYTAKCNPPEEVTFQDDKKWGFLPTESLEVLSPTRMGINTSILACIIFLSKVFDMFFDSHESFF